MLFVIIFPTVFVCYEVLLLQNLLVICRLQRRGNPFGTVHGGLGDLDGILSAVP